MIAELKKFLRENEMIGTEKYFPKNQDLSVLVVTSEWKKETGKSIFIIVDNSSHRPLLVASVMHSQTHNSILEEEFSNLNTIHGRVKDISLGRQIPVPVHLGDIGGRLALIQTAAQGVPLKIFVGRKSSLTFKSKIRNISELLFNWIMVFEESMGTEPASLSLKTSDLMVREIDRYLVQNKLPSTQMEYLQNLKNQIAESSEKFPLPKPQHNDFWVGNVLGSKNEIRGVIDWETYEKNGIPLSDLFSMVTHISFRTGRQVKGSYLLNEFYLQFHLKWYAQIVAKLFRNYCAINKINENMLKIFIPVILLKRANMMDDIIRENSIKIENTWKELFLFFVENRNHYLPLQILEMNGL